MNFRTCRITFSLALGVLCNVAVAGEDPYQMLERMSAAMSQMNYQGTFVYVRDNDVETVRITHVVDEHGTRERLVSVSGSPREVVRDSSGVRWISGDSGAVLADSATNRTFFPELPLGNTSQASDSYQFRLEAQQRIAGHTGRQLDIVPRDQYRYGYRLWLEPQSGLLLKWELTGNKGVTLAKLMFTELKMGSEVDPAELRSTASAGLGVKDAETSRAEAPAGSYRPAWQAKELPPGFRLASHRKQSASEGAFVEHLVYSDGIAAVSVYIEPAGNDPQLDMGLSKMGTTHAFSLRQGPELITALGDVPAITVKLIGNSVAPAD